MEENIPQYNFKSLAIVHKALVAGVLLFAAMSVLLAINGLTILNDKSIESIFLIVVPLFAISTYIASHSISIRRIESIKQNPKGINSKLGGYFSLLFVRWALLEAPAFLAIVSFLLIGNYVFLGIALLLAGILVFNAPSIEKTIRELELRPDESEFLKKL